MRPAGAVDATDWSASPDTARRGAYARCGRRMPRIAPDSARLATSVDNVQRSADAVIDRVDDRRFGRLVREVRIPSGWRQPDVADRAGVSSGPISRRSSSGARARLPRSAPSHRRSPRHRVSLDAWWPIGPRRPARSIGARRPRRALPSRTLRRAGWATRRRVTFNEYGERGSRRHRRLAAAGSDPGDRRGQDADRRRPGRHAARSPARSGSFPGVVARDEGWQPQRGPPLLVAVDTRQNRDVIRRIGRRSTRSGRPDGRHATPDRAATIGRRTHAGGIWFVPRASAQWHADGRRGSRPHGARRAA